MLNDVGPVDTVLRRVIHHALTNGAEGMSRTRAIRFSAIEERQIEEFLRNNSFLDFSSMARLAILGFIKDPRITVRAVKETQASESERSHAVLSKQ